MRKLFLFAVTALAAMAFATPAMATEAISVVTEDGGQNCTTATCTAHIVNEGGIELTGHVFGFPIHQLDCNNEYDLAVNAVGEGNISGFSFTPGDADCADIVACNTPWPLHGEETATPNTGILDVTVCFDTPLISCEGELDITLNKIDGDHRYEAVANDARIGNTICEVTGHWAVENTADPGNADFEIRHQ